MIGQQHIFESIIRTRRRLHEVGKDDRVLECARNPNQIQRVLIHTDLPSQARRIIAAQEGSSVRVDADAEVSHSDF